MSLSDGGLTRGSFSELPERHHKLMVVLAGQALTLGATCSHGLKQGAPASKLPIAFPLGCFKTDFSTSVASYFLR